MIVRVSYPLFICIVIVWSCGSSFLTTPPTPTCKVHRQRVEEGARSQSHRLQLGHVKQEQHRRAEKRRVSEADRLQLLHGANRLQLRETERLVIAGEVDERREVAEIQRQRLLEAVLSALEAVELWELYASATRCDSTVAVQLAVLEAVALDLDHDQRWQICL